MNLLCERRREMMKCKGSGRIFVVHTTEQLYE